MTGSVFTKTLWDQRRGLLGWSIGLAALVLIFGAFWPSVRDMPGLDEFLANYPEGLRELFNIDAMTTGAGFMNAELYSLMLPVLFLVYGIARGARLVAGEEEAGTLEVVLATPVPRWRILLEKATALAVSLAVLGAVLLASSAVASALFDMGIPLGDQAAGALAMVLLGLEHGWLALAVGAVTGRRGLAVGVAGVYAVAGYVLYVLAKFVEAVEPWQVLSQFYQALEAGPLGAGLHASLVWLAIVAVGMLAVSLPVFERRDVAT
jgi:ABC-2 type transport system permease protein